MGVELTDEKYPEHSKNTPKNTPKKNPPKKLQHGPSKTSPHPIPPEPHQPNPSLPKIPRPNRTRNLQFYSKNVLPHPRNYRRRESHAKFQSKIHQRVHRNRIHVELALL